MNLNMSRTLFSSGQFEARLSSMPWRFIVADEVRFLARYFLKANPNFTTAQSLRIGRLFQRASSCCHDLRNNPDPNRIYEEVVRKVQVVAGTLRVNEDDDVFKAGLLNQFALEPLPLLFAKGGREDGGKDIVKDIVQDKRKAKGNDKVKSKPAVAPPKTAPALPTRQSTRKRQATQRKKEFTESLTKKKKGSPKPSLKPSLKPSPKPQPRRRARTKRQGTLKEIGQFSATQEEEPLMEMIEDWRREQPDRLIETFPSPAELQPQQPPQDVDQTRLPPTGFFSTISPAAQMGQARSTILDFPRVAREGLMPPMGSFSTKVPKKRG
ncbi:hypothetical protein B0J11DRAFT_510536 [Dendryphion nanum]|uniref:Uncharacterized protein n=1 Tax=Dendryphion nanum TaxID=256645 RepID=A0A9P9DBY7_9PLEO|nr:hypothetical protein B0J11DRAFT_510536 [Dendryphion nanum]